MSVETMHMNCVGCQEEAAPSTSAAGALTVLAMLTAHPLDEVTRALCFKHRRDVEIAADALIRGPAGDLCATCEHPRLSHGPRECIKWTCACQGYAEKP